MAITHSELQHHEEPTPPTGEELANRLFGVVMAGLCGVILLMIVFGDIGTF